MGGNARKTGRLPDGRSRLRIGEILHFGPIAMTDLNASGGPKVGGSNPLSPTLNPLAISREFVGFRLRQAFTRQRSKQLALREFVGIGPLVSVG